MFRISFISVLLLFCFSIEGFGQSDTIKLNNPSFEGNPLEGGAFARLPKGWEDCGFPGETAPDVHPVKGGNFSVGKGASHGETYIGMVVRDNDSWERISQKLSSSLLKGKCYKFKIDAARSETYLSQSRMTRKPTNYVTPAKLRIYGGTEHCGKEELLGETSLIKNTEWLEYSFNFEPTSDYNYILLEAFYNTPTLFLYNGNILIDNASHIIEIPCDGEEPLIAAVEKPKSSKPKNRDRLGYTDVPNSSKPTFRPKTLPELNISEIEIGQKIRIKELFFEANSDEVPAEYHYILDELYEFLKAYPDVKIEIGGHTNTIPPNDYCDDLSARRAKAVTTYLNRKGISGRRLIFTGYGKRIPLTLDTSPEGRKENQRVEIKILSVNG